MDWLCNGRPTRRKPNASHHQITECAFVAATQCLRERLRTFDSSTQRVRRVCGDLYRGVHAFDHVFHSGERRIPEDRATLGQQ